MIGRTGTRSSRRSVGGTPHGTAVLTCLALVTLGTPAAGQVFSRRPPIADAPDDVQWPIHYGHVDQEAVDAASMMPGTAEHALRRFVNLHSADRHAEALVAIREVLALAPDRPLVHYNHACVLGRLGAVDDALAALDAARHFGWRDMLHAQVDGDLATVRADPRFAAWLERVRADRAAEATTPRRHRHDVWPVVANELEHAVATLMPRHHVPGLAIALVRDGNPVWSGGYGVADDRGTPFDADVPFGSTLQANLLALACAVELEAAGRFDLERLILSDVWVSSRASDATTAFDGARGRRLVSRRERGAHAPRPERRLCVWPSEEERCHGGTTLQQRLDQHLLGHFESFAEQRVILQNGLRATAFGPLTPEALDRLANGHTALGTCLPAAAIGEGEAVTTTGDLQRMMTILMRSHREAMSTPAGRRLHELVRDDLALQGLGLTIVESIDGAVVQGVSMHDGIGCVMRFWPDRRDGVVIVFNSATGTDAALQLADLAVGGVGPATAPTPPVPRDVLHRRASD